MHIAQADGVAGLTAVEAPLFCQDHPIVQAERVDHGGRRTQPEVVVPTTMTLSQPSSVRLEARLVPKKLDGFCLLITMPRRQGSMMTTLPQPEYAFLGTRVYLGELRTDPQG